MVKYNILFYPQKVTDDVARLRMRVRWEHCEVAINVGYNIDRDKWSKETQRCKRNTYHGKKKVSAQIINAEIQRWENAVNTILGRCDSSPSSQDFKASLLNIVAPNKVVKSNSHTFLSDFDTFVTEQSKINAWADSTIHNFQYLLRTLTAWKSNIDYSDFTVDGLQDYIKYCEDKGMKNTSIKERIRLVKWFLRWSVKNEYCTLPVALDFAPKLKQIDNAVVFLDWDELMRMYKARIDDTKLSVVRDMFCLSCFTGLRYSDIQRLNASNIVNDSIIIATKKTNTSLRIELNKYSRTIVERYANNEERLFPIMLVQDYNGMVRKVAEQCHIDASIIRSYYIGNERYDKVYKMYELLSSHCGRRTFICNALMLGVPVNIVMKWTGHSDYGAMKPYIDIADKAKAEAMKVFDR